MDLDENDLLYSNTFIPIPELQGEVTSQQNNEFKTFYEREKSINEEARLRDSIERMSIRSIRLTEETDDQSIMNTNKFVKGSQSIKSVNVGQQPSSRRTKEIVTYVSIDSRDRDKLQYLKPSHFKIFLGRSFYNVKSIKLASIEFPNTNAVINSSNHNVYWKNYEDVTTDTINAITNVYPEYSVQLRIGSYVSSSLQTELASKLATIRRKDGSGDYHYFIVTLDIDTDVVTFTSLILTQLSNNPIQTSVNTGVLEITAPSHGYSDGEYIYLVGVKAIAGIQSTTLNAMHKITKINDNIFRIEVNIKASDTLLGGGNTVKTGKIAPFKFLFGEKPFTVAPNIGYPLENSSDLNKMYIQSIANLYQASIVTKDPHNITNADLNGLCTISSSGTTPSLNGSRRITQVISSTTFYVRLDSLLVLESYNSGQVTFGGVTFNIQSISNVNVNTILVSTFTPHNYSRSDIGKVVTLYNTTTTPSLDDTHILYNVFEETSFVIPGSIPSGGFSPPGGLTRTPGLDGSIASYNPFSTHIVSITNVFLNVSTTTFTCIDHRLQVGDTIKFFNLYSTPTINDISFEVFAVPNANTIIINYKLNSYDASKLSGAYISTGLFHLSFPNHGFNNIVSIQNTSGVPDSGSGSLIQVQTQLPHNFTSGKMVRLQNTNTTPVIDEGYTITVTGSDTFTIPYSYPLVSGGTSGIIGFDQDFYIYGCTDIGNGNVKSNEINNKLFTVREIVNEHNISFYNSGVFPIKSESGGGNFIYISSLLHGFSGQQTNTKNSLLNRSINLQGENYAFLSCPQLSTMLNTGSVKNIFARISLDQSPGSMVFSYLSNPKVFDAVPLNQLNELEFSILNYDGTEYEFNDLDYSFTLQITEVIDITDNFNLSSKRGIIDT